jgi:RimJ/RimL family protein N-acetyltransferase
MTSHREASATRLVAATPSHFDWAIAGLEGQRSPDGLSLPPGGLEVPEVLAWLARTAAKIKEATGRCGAWLVVHGDEAVGLISFKGPPHDGAIEIGYGIAPSRRRRGHATAAVGELIAEATRRELDLIAEAGEDNLPSQRVLEHHGFQRVGARTDPEDGVLISYRRDRTGSGNSG